MIRLAKKLEQQARTDHLSGLLNRLSISEIIDYELLRFKRSQKPFALIMGDVDYFKKINDSAGHLAGDQVIKDIAALIKNSLREQDCAARWGGEEFLIFLPETDKENAIATIERLRKDIENTIYINNSPVTMSFGIAIVKNKETFDDLLSRSDKNMYHAKEHGRNSIVA